jgi:RNA polymerase sigma factor (sigma-70 family)
LDDLKTLVTRAQSGNLEAYTQLVHRFQDMAVGYAYSLLGDFHLAEDAAQEAFVGAYQDLARLREPGAFVTWFRRLVATRCSRYIRRKRIATVPLDATPEIAAPEIAPDRALETAELHELALETVQTLPEAERTVLSLFYMGEYPQREIGAFLNLPVTTVKNHLRSAKSRVRERMMAMAQDELRDKRPSKDEKFTVKIIDDLLHMPDSQMRNLLETVGRHTDLTITMQQAGPEVREKIYANLPPEKRDRLERDVFFYTPPEDKNPDEARERVLQKAGQALDGTLPPPLSAQEPFPPVIELKEKVEETPFACMDLVQRVDFFIDLAQIARARGVVTYEQLVDDVDQPGDDIFLQDAQLLGMGIRLIVDGTWPSLVREMMETRTRALLQFLETRHQMIVAGVLGVQEGRNPLGLAHHLYNHFGFGDADPPGMTETRQSGKSLNPTKEELGVERFSDFGSPAKYGEIIHRHRLEALRPLSVRKMVFPELCDLFMMLDEEARREGIHILKDLMELIDYDLLQRGLQLTIEGAEPDLIRELLQGRSRNLLRQQEVRYRMICVGIESIQVGEYPQVIAERIRCLFES